MRGLARRGWLFFLCMWTGWKETEERRMGRHGLHRLTWSKGAPRTVTSRRGGGWWRGRTTVWHRWEYCRVRWKNRDRGGSGCGDAGWYVFVHGRHVDSVIQQRRVYDHRKPYERFLRSRWRCGGLYDWSRLRELRTDGACLTRGSERSLVFAHCRIPERSSSIRRDLECSPGYGRRSPSVWTVRTPG